MNYENVNVIKTKKGQNMFQMKRYFTVSATDDPRLDPAPEGVGGGEDIIGSIENILIILESTSVSH